MAKISRSPHSHKRIAASCAVRSPAAGTGLSVRSAIRLDQIRTVDRQRLVRRLGAADSAIMDKVDEALKISLGLLRI